MPQQQLHWNSSWSLPPIATTDGPLQNFPGFFFCIKLFIYYKTLVLPCMFSKIIIGILKKSYYNEK